MNVKSVREETQSIALNIFVYHQLCALGYYWHFGISFDAKTLHLHKCDNVDTTPHHCRCH